MILSSNTSTYPFLNGVEDGEAAPGVVVPGVAVLGEVLMVIGPRCQLMMTIGLMTGMTIGRMIGMTIGVILESPERAHTVDTASLGKDPMASPAKDPMASLAKELTVGNQIRVVDIGQRFRQGAVGVMLLVVGKVHTV